MAIQVAQITGDTVELVFNPAEDHLHVGENLSVAGHQEDRGLIVQIIELKTIGAAPLLSSRPPYTSETPHSVSAAVTHPPSRSPRRRKASLPAREIGGLHLAIGKIRKVADPAWHPWDGWIPMRGATVTKTADREMLRQCIPGSENPLRLGKTLAGEPFHIDRMALGAVNLIVGAKGSGTSHLAKVIASELIVHGARCVVFDTTGTYALLSPDSENPSLDRKERPVIVRLVVGESLKLGMPHLGLDALSAMLRQFGLPTAVALYFESHVARHLARTKEQAEANQPAPFLGIDELLGLAQSLEAAGQAVVGGAILSCLEAIKKTQILAAQPAEAMAFWHGYAQIRHGGALVIDLSKLPRRARTSLVFALVSSLRDIAEQDFATESSPAPSLFFDDAQSLGARRMIADVLIPARPLGITSFFVTTMVSGLDNSLLHEADNLFLRQMASDEDVRHLAKRGIVDADTLRGVVRCLRDHDSLLIGKATAGYPIIFAARPSGDAEMTDERSAFSHTSVVGRMDATARARARSSTRVQASVAADPGLPLFPDETPARAVPPAPCDAERRAATSPSPTPSVAQVTAMWDHVVKRVARRRRILETILAAARPLRVVEHRLVLGFPPQHRFQQELVEAEEYRRLLEEELKKAFGVSLEVTTEVYPA